MTKIDHHTIHLNTVKNKRIHLYSTNRLKTQKRMLVEDRQQKQWQNKTGKERRGVQLQIHGV